MSRSAHLQKLAVAMTGRHGGVVRIAPEDRLLEAVTSRFVETAAEGARIVLLGATMEGLAERLEAATSARGARIDLIEPDLRRRTRSGAAAQAWRDLAFGDLATDPAHAQALLAEAPPHDLAALRAVTAQLLDVAAQKPVIADETVDSVLIDLVANRLPAAEYDRTLAETYRVLARGGRLVTAVLVADEPPSAVFETRIGAERIETVPLEIDALAQIAAAGFHGLTIETPLVGAVAAEKGVELRLFLISAYKGKVGPCCDQGHAVIYRGPWSETVDDDGHRYRRGERTAVCSKTHALLMSPPYAGQFVSLPPFPMIPLDKAPLFDCNTPSLRDPAITKGNRSVLDGRDEDAPCCAPGGVC